MPDACRCGYTPSSRNPVHPCHGKGYQCGREARQRLYVAGPHSLSGSTLKVSATSTWACDDCWLEFSLKFPGHPARTKEDQDVEASSPGDDDGDEEKEAWFPYDR